MKSVHGNFAIVDDLLREADRGRLRERGTISIETAGRIGPLVELMVATRQRVDQYNAISVNSRFYQNLSAAFHTKNSFGSDYADTEGAFPLGIVNPVVTSNHLWDHWCIHAENIAKRSGLNQHLVASLMGAMLEIQDNIYEHSAAPQTGLVAYAITEKSFEFVVADQGAGVLATLRQNPRYSEIPHSGIALEEMIKEGVSRFPSETDRGLGFQQLFRALVGHNAHLRFRSGDHALTMKPADNKTHGETTLSHLTNLDGLIVSVFCEP